MSALLNARRKASACALATLVAWLCAQPSRGDLASRYSAGKQRAGQISTVVQAATRRLQGYQGTIDALQARLAVIQSSVATQDRLLGGVRTQLSGARLRPQDLQWQYVRDRALLAAELRSEYETPPPNVIRVIVDAHGFEDLLTGLNNLKAIERENASITGLVASRRLVGVAAARAAAENIHADWLTGDLQQLPFADGSFELVTSIFGVIFALDPQRAISEIIRVLVPGGRALITTWVPEGGIDAAVGIAVRAVSAAAGQAPPPRFPWADKAAVSGIVAQAGGEVSFFENQLNFTDSSPEAYHDKVQAVHPMSVATRPLLERAGTYDEVRGQMISALAAHNEDPSGLRLTSRYLIAEIRPTSAA